MSMMKRKAATKDHLLLADEIQRWSEANDVARDPYVIGIQDALRNRKKWPMWASIDPFELLPHSMVNEKAPLSKISFYATMARNVLVFVPVALTWSAVSHATTAFAKYATQNESAVVNFLEFWQNGYGVLAKEWTIGFIAFLDFALIAAVIVLTLFITMLDRQIIQFEDKFLAALDVERTGVALKILDFFFSKKVVTQAVVNQGIAQSLNQLLNVSEALVGTTKALEKSSKEAIKGNLKLIAAKEKFALRAGR
jgi:hypothetical protein